MLRLLPEVLSAYFPSRGRVYGTEDTEIKVNLLKDNTELSMVHSFTPEVGQNIALHASPAVQNAVFVFSNIHFSSVQSLDRLGRRGKMRDDSVRSSTSLFCRRPLLAKLAWAGMSTL